MALGNRVCARTYGSGWTHLSDTVYLGTHHEPALDTRNGLDYHTL